MSSDQATSEKSKHSSRLPKQRASNYTTGIEIDFDSIDRGIKDLTESYAKLLVGTESWAIFAFVDILLGKKRKKLKDENTKVLVLLGGPTIARGIALGRIRGHFKTMLGILDDFSLVENKEMVDDVRRAKGIMNSFLNKIPPTPRGITALGIGTTISTFISIISLAVTVTGNYPASTGIVSALLVFAILTSVTIVVLGITLVYAEAVWSAYLVRRFQIATKEKLLLNSIRPLAGRLIKKIFE